MCLNPIKIYSRSERLGKNSPIYITVPCGKCAECQKARHTDYCVRAYWEYKDTLLSGGYCYFDTLTYSNENLPKFQNIPCFSKEHVTKFIKDLRRQLDYHLFEKKGIKDSIKGTLKYFLTSEYGGKKHRPHYHILFYVSNPLITPRVLKYFINKCWSYGITDSVATIDNRIVHGIQAISYVTKYVTKDQDYLEVVDAKLSRILKCLGNDSHAYKYTLEKSKQCRPFFKTSTHFGEAALNLCDANLLLDGKITIEDAKVLHKEIALPMYYQRKLFYNLTKVDGKYRWKLNGTGRRFKIDHLDEKIKLTAEKFETIYNNLSNYCLPDYFPLEHVKSTIDNYLGSRSWLDFATYVIVYKGKRCTSKYLPDYKTFYASSLEEGTQISNLYSEDTQLRSSARSRLEKQVIGQYRFPEFAQLDNLYILLNLLTRDTNVGKQNLADYKQSLISKYKLLKP